jgi:hypothetical protein
VTRARLAALLILSAASFAASPTSPAPTPTPAPPSSQAGTVPKLSSREKAARMKDLSSADRSWLTEYVDPIILPDEVNLFLSLPAGYPRDMFREEFWKRRERDGLPPPFGPGYRFRYEHLLEVADGDYEGRFSDGGRLVVRRGEPAGLQEFKDCSEVFRQAEIWTYPPETSAGKDLHFLFYRPSFGAPRRLWLPGDNEIFQTASCIASFDQACARTPNGAPPSVGSSPCAGLSVPRSCDSACYVSRIADEIRSRGTAGIAAAANFAPGVSTEGLGSLWDRLATSSDPNAKKIGVEGPSSVAAARSAPPAPEPEPAVWTPEAIRDRIMALPKKYREFLDAAAPIMSDAELVAFLQSKPSERDGFIRRFWRQHGKKG